MTRRALHRRRAGGGRHRHAAIVAPGDRFRDRAGLQGGKFVVAGRRRAERLRRNYLAEDDHAGAGVGEAGKTTAYIARTIPQLGREGRTASSRSRPAVRTSGCPVRWVTPRSASCVPATAASTTSRGRSTGARRRPLDRFVTRVQNGLVQLGPRYSVNSQLKRFSPRDPASTRRPLAVPLPEALHARPVVRRYHGDQDSETTGPGRRRKPPPPARLVRTARP
jgi:hypothetical protein